AVAAALKNVDHGVNEMAVAQRLPSHVALVEAEQVHPQADGMDREAEPRIDEMDHALLVLSRQARADSFAVDVDGGVAPSLQLTRSEGQDLILVALSASLHVRSSYYLPCTARRTISGVRCESLIRPPRW